MTVKPEKYLITNSFTQKESKKLFWLVLSSRNEPNYFILPELSTQHEPRRLFWFIPGTQNESHNFRHSFRVVRMSPVSYFGSFRAKISINSIYHLNLENNKI